MSLVVWFPLNGSLKNQGLSDITIVNSNATIDNNGKIGKCYYFNNSYLRFLDPIKNTNDEFSIALWFKTTDASAQQCIYNGRTTIGKSVAIFILGSNIRFDDDNQHTDTLTLSSNVWYHLVCTYKKNGKKCIYLNGIKRLETDASSTLSKTNNYATIGMSSSNDGTPGSNIYKGYFNDFRIYNHALSESEVKEISQGLVGHYRLTGNGNSNLCNNLITTGSNVNNITFKYNYDSASNVFSAEVLTIPTSGSGGFQNSLGFSKTTDKIGKTYTWSLWAKASRNMTITNCGHECGGRRRIDLTTKWQYFTYTWTYTDSTYSSFTFYNAVSNWKVGDIIYIKNVKIEEGSVATPFIPPSVTTSTNKINAMGYNFLVEEDCSGLGNKGTKKNNFTYDINSPINESCYNFTGDNCIMCYRGGMVTDEITLSCWAYMSDWTKVTSLISCTESGGWNLEKHADGINFALASTTNTYTTNTIIPNAKLTAGWHMITVTYDGLCKKAYVDGVLVITTNLYTTKTPIKYHSSNGIFIGAESAGSQTSGESQYMPAGSKMSDVRIYATALTQDQITELYNKKKI